VGRTLGAGAVLEAGLGAGAALDAGTGAMLPAAARPEKARIDAATVNFIVMFESCKASAWNECKW
jgi:hypothetical protein